MLSENGSSDDVGSTQRSDNFLAALSRPHIIDQVTQTVPKKRTKCMLYLVQGKIDIFWCRRNHTNRGKIVAAWQYHVLDRYLCQRTSNSIYGTFHEAFSMWKWVSLKAEGKHICYSSWSTPSTGQVIRVYVSLSWCSLDNSSEVLITCRL